MFWLEGELAPEDLPNYHSEYRAEVSHFDDERLEVSVGFRLHHHVEGEEEPHDDSDIEEQPLKVFVDYLLDYAVTSPGIGPDDLEAFADINAVFNAWAYWRQLVHSTLPTMGLGPLVIPVFRVPLSAQTPAPAPAAPTKRPSSKRAKKSATPARGAGTKKSARDS